MATVLHQQSGGASSNFAAGVVNYYHIGSNQVSNDTSVEANRVLLWRSAGVLSNLYILVITNDRGTSTYRTRKATADANLVISITASTTGKFEDNVNTDAVTAGDNWHASLTVGAGGTTFQINPRSVVFTATTNTVQRMSGGGPAVNIATASATNPVPLYGNGAYIAGETDANVGITLRSAGTLKNLFVLVTANARTTTTTFRSRVDAGFGNLTVSVTSGATGNFEDTANSDTLIAGQLINASVTTSTGTETLTSRVIAVDFETTNGNHQFVSGISAGVSQTAGLTRYYSLSGNLSAITSEAAITTDANVAFTSSLLQCNISANTIVLDSTLTLRKNSGVANQTVTITALTTGIFQDTVNTDSILASDTLNYQIVTPSTLTAITIRSISLLGDSSISRNISLIERKTFRGVLRGVGRGSI